jgi:hypothetical protein
MKTIQGVFSEVHIVADGGSATGTDEYDVAISSLDKDVTYVGVLEPPSTRFKLVAEVEVRIPNITITNHTLSIFKA